MTSTLGIAYLFARRVSTMRRSARAAAKVRIAEARAADIATESEYARMELRAALSDVL